MILVFLCIGSEGYSQSNLHNTKVTISFKKESLKSVLKKIESKTGVGFVYSNLPVLENKISGNYTDETLHSILANCFEGTNLAFKEIRGKITVYISKDTRQGSREPNLGNSTISGYVYEKSTGEALIGCTVYIKNTSTGTVTNNFGFFSLSLSKSKLPSTIIISYIGFQEEEIYFRETTKMNFYLQDMANSLGEVVVGAKKADEVVTNTKIGTMELTAAEIKAIPAIGGETDVLKAITLLPGVKQGVDGSAGFYVRGGGPDQNLILLDGVPIYNPYHLWGFLSTFNADAINNIEITKGAFPARYGGRLSSVLDITTKEGNNQEWKTSLNVGLLSAKASVSAPIVKDKSSFILSARRTYADLLIVPILKKQNSGDDTKVTEGYNFMDFNGKFNYILSDKDRLFVSGFYSRDKYYFNQKTDEKGENFHRLETLGNEQGWNNIVSSVRWNHLFGNKLFVNSTAYFSRYNFLNQNQFEQDFKEGNEIEKQNNSIEYFSAIQDLAIKQDYHFFPNNRNNIRFGTSGIFHEFTPGVNSFFSKTDKQTIDNTIKNNNITANEFALYAEDDIELNRFIRLNAGLHVSLFNVQGKNYHSIQPRLSARFLLNKNLSLKTGFSKMTQYLHLLTSLGISQSSDLWVPSTSKVPPQQAYQFSLGMAWKIAPEWQLEVEGYYKEMKDIISYKDGVSFLNTATSWEDKVAIGEGEAYGMEVFLKKNQGKWTGWLGYTLSWTNRKFEEINFGETYPYRYDRRHDISVVGSYQISDKWTLNGAWVFYTGNATTLATSGYVGNGYDGNFHAWSSFPTSSSTTSSDISDTGIIENPIKRNNFRLPSYHRLDLTATKKIVHKKSTANLTFGITNIYNRFNPSFYITNHERDLSTGEIKVKIVTRTLFPIMPTISYGITF